MERSVFRFNLSLLLLSFSLKKDPPECCVTCNLLMGPADQVLSTRPPTRTEIHALLKNRMVMKSEFVVLSRQKSTLFDFYFYST